MKVLLMRLIFLSGLFPALSGCGELDLGGVEDADANSDLSVDDPDSPDPLDPDVPTTDLPWNPDIDNLGSPGWRGSTEPWCPGINGLVMSYDVWSHDGGVYVLVADTENTGMRYEDMNRIFLNGGRGWSAVYEATAASELEGDTTSCFRCISGFSTGSLLAWHSPSHSCRFAYIEDGTVTWGDFYMWDLFVVNDNLAYAIGTFEDIEIVKYEAGAWEIIPAVVPYSVHSIWADEQDVFAIGEGGTVVSLEEGAWRIHDTGTVDNIRSIWGFSGEDVWVGQDDGTLRHFDGSEWTPVEWPNRETSGPMMIAGIWGRDGVLFFHTGHQLTMRDSRGFSVLGYWKDAGIHIQAIWGNSPTEVFLAVVDQDHEIAGCGPEYLLWWDGSAFHWF